MPIAAATSGFRTTANASTLEKNKTTKRLTLQGLADKIGGFPSDVPVSSRGQDTWFSATGPGFESPYRYQPSRNHDSL